MKENDLKKSATRANLHKGGLRVGFANFFGVFAYVSVAFQLMLVILIYFRWIYELFLGPIKDIVPVEPIPAVPVEQVASEPSVFVYIFGVIIVAAMVALTIYAIIKTPSMIAKGGKKVVDTAAEQTTNAVLRARHKKNTPRNRKKLTPKFVIIFKGIGVILPLVLAWFSQFLPDRILDFKITMILSIGLAGISLVLFALQYLLAVVLKVDRKSLK